jgi:hypothetical protein
MTEVWYVVWWLNTEANMPDDEKTTPPGYEDSIMAKYMNTPVNPNRDHEKKENVSDADGTIPDHRNPEDPHQD